MVACLSFQNWKIFCISVVHHGLYDNDVVTLMTVYKWYERFKSKNQSAQDKPLEHQIRQIEKSLLLSNEQNKNCVNIFLDANPNCMA